MLILGFLITLTTIIPSVGKSTSASLDEANAACAADA